MDDTETRSIELSRVEAREVIMVLSEFRETAAAQSESEEETVMNVQNRFEEMFEFKDSENNTDETLPGGY